jgi:hypothetical protein
MACWSSGRFAAETDIEIRPMSVADRPNPATDYTSLIRFWMAGVGRQAAAPRFCMNGKSSAEAATGTSIGQCPQCW